jgi:hypothetical protein
MCYNLLHGICNSSDVNSMLQVNTVSYITRPRHPGVVFYVPQQLHLIGCAGVYLCFPLVTDASLDKLHSQVSQSPQLAESNLHLASM